MILLAGIIVLSTLGIPLLHSALSPRLGTPEGLEMMRSLFLAVGGALIGAAAIVFSFVLFSMQVNVERMPYGLFRRLSADWRLLGAFAGAFALALLVAVLSLVANVDSVGTTVFAGGWATAMVLLLFLYSYRRALTLINPVRQMGLVVAGACREFNAWGRRAKRAEPLMATPPIRRQGDPFAPKYDLVKLAYFRLNPHWSDGAKRAVRHAVSFGRRYAEQGDYEVSAAAMNAIAAINAAYVEAKGRTFFTHQLIFENPLTSDGFINDTLEHLRQTTRIGIARRDEQQIEQTLRGIAQLAHLYATIDYGAPNASKTHAHLAASYLTAEVEQVAPHNMADVLMEGARLMGQCGDTFLAEEGPSGIHTLVDKLGVIGCLGVAREDYRPVTSICVEQLARLSFNLLRTRSREVQFAAEDLRKSMSLVAKLFLAVPETPLTWVHSTHLGAWYSSTSPEALSPRLTAFANAISDAASDNEDAERVIDNLRAWSEGIYRTEKELLLEAIKRRSQFTFDMIHWITTVATVLIDVSNADACNAYNRDKLRKNALWLISVLSFVPYDVETVKFIENFQMTDTIYDSAVDAYHRDCPDIGMHVMDLLLAWAFKAGQYPTGWAILQRAVYGLAVLALLMEADGAVTRLKSEMAKRLTAGGLPDQTVRDDAALDIRGRAASLLQYGFLGTSIEAGIAQSDHSKLQPLLEELADLISPQTKGRANSTGFI